MSKFDALDFSECRSEEVIICYAQCINNHTYSKWVESFRLQDSFAVLAQEWSRVEFFRLFPVLWTMRKPPQMHD